VTGLDHHGDDPAEAGVGMAGGSSGPETGLRSVSVRTYRRKSQNRPVSHSAPTAMIAKSDTPTSMPTGHLSRVARSSGGFLSPGSGCRSVNRRWPSGRIAKVSRSWLGMVAGGPAGLKRLPSGQARNLEGCGHARGTVGRRYRTFGGYRRRRDAFSFAGRGKSRNCHSPRRVGPHEVSRHTHGKP
jgi:hypothetical protein